MESRHEEGPRREGSTSGEDEAEVGIHIIPIGSGVDRSVDTEGKRPR